MERFDGFTVEGKDGSIKIFADQPQGKDYIDGKAEIRAGTI